MAMALQTPGDYGMGEMLKTGEAFYQKGFNTLKDIETMQNERQKIKQEVEKRQRLSKIYDDADDRGYFTTEDLENLTVLDPERAAAYDAGWQQKDEAHKRDLLKTSGMIDGAFAMGKPELAKQLLQDKLEMAKKSNDQSSVKTLETLVGLLNEGGEEGAKMVRMMNQQLMASGMGMEAFKEFYNKQRDQASFATQAIEVQDEQGNLFIVSTDKQGNRNVVSVSGDASQPVGKLSKPVEDTADIQNYKQYQEILKKDGQQAATLFARQVGMEKVPETSMSSKQWDIVADASTKAQQARVGVDTYNDITKRLYEQGEEMSTGIAATGEDFVRGLLGKENADTILRGDVGVAINKMMLDSLPAGAASDKDIEMARKPLPKETADYKVLAPWIAGKAKLQVVASEYEQFKADYISSTGRGDFDKAWRDHAKDIDWQEKFRPYDPQVIASEIERSKEIERQRAVQRDMELLNLNKKEMFNGKEYIYNSETGKWVRQ